MKRFEYEITSHPADTFRELIYFCSSHGECNLGQIPTDQTRKVNAILNERGQDGWELVQATFGKDGILIFWKRMIKKNSDKAEIVIDG